jgi:hypothetical protein
LVKTLPFGARASAADQTRILSAALDAIGALRPGAAFDLDSTVLSNKPRQARIVRDFGRATGDERLAACSEEAVVSWYVRDTARQCGLSKEEVDAIEQRLRQFWLERFFTSEYCKDDRPVPGAPEFLRRILQRGGRILYVTGRHAGMESGTLHSFRAAEFPLPDGDRVQLWLKPKLEDDDDGWKRICHERLRALSAVACAFDNEPAHVNAYKLAFPEAHVVHLDTDHSGRPVEVLPSIPSIADFRMR